MRLRRLLRLTCLFASGLAGATRADDASIETVLSSASAINATRPGQQYNAMLYAGTGMDNTKAMILVCGSLYPPEDMEGMVVSGVVHPGGVLRHPRVLPDTPFTQCFMRRFASQQFPPLPVATDAFPMALVIDVASGHASDPFTSFTKKSDRAAVVRASMPLYAPRPVYPARTAKGQTTGDAMVLIVFGNLGTPTDVHIEKSSGDPGLDAAVLYAARRWVFRPTLGRRLSVRVPISFALQADGGPGGARAWTPADDQ